MDVYVVLNVWKERASVAGAGVSPEDAEDIANRLGGDYGWADWLDEPTPGRRGRRALWAGGTVHPDHTQEIVRTPLAGFSIAPTSYGVGVPTFRTKAESWTVREADLEDVRTAVSTRLNEMLLDRVTVKEIRIGDGVAKEWFLRKLQDEAIYPSNRTVAPDVFAEVSGIPVRVDADLPPNQIWEIGRDGAPTAKHVIGIAGEDIHGGAVTIGEDGRFRPYFTSPLD